jgi:hypothetical protein
LVRRKSPPQKKPHDRCAPQKRRGPPQLDLGTSLQKRHAYRLTVPAAQEAIAALQREFAAEALLVAAIKAAAGFYPDGRIAEIFLSAHLVPILKRSAAL